MTLCPNNITALLPECGAIDAAAADAGARMQWAQVPGKMAVYLLVDTANNPMLLATVGNLRAALQRRLSDTQAEQKSKRVQYGQLCPRVFYRVIHSPFAANWYYYQAARMLFPDTYGSMISWRPASFISVNPADLHPRFRRTEDLSDSALSYLGPIRDRRSADQLIQSLEDLFDLCRYHYILLQSPNARACAYKEMGKCPGPCDGSVTLEHYHRQIGEALAYLSVQESRDLIFKGQSSPRAGYQSWRRQIERSMTESAARLDFERAAKLKSQLLRGAILEQPAYAHLNVLQNFTYLSLQPGPGKAWVEPIFIHGGKIEPADPIKRKDLPQACKALHQKFLELAAIPIALPLTQQATEQIALIAHHLFRGPDDAGVYLGVHEVINEESIFQAAVALLDRKNPPKPIAEQSSDQNAARGETPAPAAAVGADVIALEGKKALSQ